MSIQMAKQDNDELLAAVESGVAADVQKITRKNVYTPDQRKSKRAAVIASEKNLVKCLEVLLAWGVSTEATNDIDGETGATCLHVAAKYASMDTLKFLLRRRANVNAKQGEGLTPVQCAIAQANKEAAPGAASAKHIEAIKMLLKNGAKITNADHATGLAVAVREVQFEAVTTSLREATLRQVTTAHLEEAEARVKEAMAEHLELIEHRERAKAGQQLIEFEAVIKAEMLVAQRSKTSAAKLQMQLNERSILYEGARKELEGVDRDMVELGEELQEFEAQQEALTTELEERHAELEQHNSELGELRSTRQEAEDAHDEAEARHGEWESEVAASRARAAEVKAEVVAARGELRGWLKDKEDAHRLTEQAKQVLGRKVG